MKMKAVLKSSLLIGLIILITSVFYAAVAQNDATQVLLTDSTMVVQPDTTQVLQSDTIIEQTTEEVKSNENKRKDEFILYAGINYSQLGLSSNTYESSSDPGFQLGFAYRRGAFLYWQAGAQYNNTAFGFQNVNLGDQSTSLTLQSLDIPLTGGINFLSFANRIVGLRAFVSAVPSFVINVGDNSYDITKDDINTFIFYGQVGIGANLTFLILDVGYNYGFQDVLTSEKSKPGQVFINLGLRF